MGMVKDLVGAWRQPAVGVAAAGPGDDTAAGWGWGLDRRWFG